MSGGAKGTKLVGEGVMARVHMVQEKRCFLVSLWYFQLYVPVGYGTRLGRVEKIATELFSGWVAYTGRRLQVNIF